VLQHSGQHIDKIYLSYEAQQPHDDWSGIHKVVNYFRGNQANLVVVEPAYFLGLGANDLARAKTDSRYRQSIIHQYAFEHTDKPYLCVMHNDMLFHQDLIGAMLGELSDTDSMAGVGQIGQCWNCPALSAQRCSPATMSAYVPSQQEAIALHQSYPIPRQANALAILERGFVHPLPECRLNEYCALVNVDSYRKLTVPIGDIGCFGGNWGGSDTAAMWFHQMYNAGCRFVHFDVHALATHAAFDGSGSGSEANDNRSRYYQSEENARLYIDAHYERKAVFGPSVRFKTTWYGLKRKIRRLFARTVGAIKETVGPG
jgi:hypothetical protein